MNLFKSSNCPFIFLALTMLAAVSIPFVGISTLLPTFARCSFSLRSSSIVCFCFISMFSARIFRLLACLSIKSESLSILSCCASSASMTALLLAVGVALYAALASSICPTIASFASSRPLRISSRLSSALYVSVSLRSASSLLANFLYTSLNLASCSL